jgi:hypothetical protein
MSIPSIKTLAAVFNERAKEARDLIDQKIKTRTYKSVIDLEKASLCPVGYSCRLMTALNEIAGTSGIESLYFTDHDVWPDVEYLNAGDIYAPTLFRDCKSGKRKVFVSCVAEAQEMYQNKKAAKLRM